MLDYMEKGIKVADGTKAANLLTLRWEDAAARLGGPMWLRATESERGRRRENQRDGSIRQT